MRISVIGAGYVGLVTAACLADFGHHVTAVDIDRGKIDRLRRGEVPFYEQGLAEVMVRNMREDRLGFTADLPEGIRDALVVFIAVGTPPLVDGAADLSQVKAAAHEIAFNLRDYKVIVNKSTSPVGTAHMLHQLIAESLPRAVEFDVVSNPEFLREGTAVYDFTHPDRVVIGAESPRAMAIMKEIYRPLYLIETPFVLTNLETAELIKYAANAFLATKIAFINEIANLCEAVGADVQTLAKAIGLDGRIGAKFLHAGPGFGGACFPKDTRALVRIAQEHGERVSVVEAVIEANEGQKRRMVKKIQKVVGDLRGKTIAVLGLAFKQNTDDVRESPALAIIQGLLSAGAVVRTHDPEAIAEARRVLGDRVVYCNDAYEAATGADALVIATEWNSYRRLDLVRMRALLRSPLLIDLRNIYTPSEAASAGLAYEGVGCGIRSANREIGKGFDEVAAIGVCD